MINILPYIFGLAVLCWIIYLKKAGKKSSATDGQTADTPSAPKQKISTRRKIIATALVIGLFGGWVLSLYNSSNEQKEEAKERVIEHLAGTWTHTEYVGNNTGTALNIVEELTLNDNYTFEYIVKEIDSNKRVYGSVKVSGTFDTDESYKRVRRGRHTHNELTGAKITFNYAADNGSVNIKRSDFNSQEQYEETSRRLESFMKKKGLHKARLSVHNGRRGWQFTLGHRKFSQQ